MPRDLAWLRPVEIAKRHGVKVDVVLSWIHRGELRAVNVGAGMRRRRWQISPEALDAFYAARGNRVPVRTVRSRRQSAVMEFV